MQTLIRKSVFETNSSSCHSITIGKMSSVPDPKQFHNYLNDNGEFVIPYGEFGWEQETHRDMMTLASYLITYYDPREVHEWRPGPDTDAIENTALIKESIAKYLSIDVEKIIFKENTGACWERGYVDHQSDRFEEGLLIN